jgi:hypothetical protein
MPFLLRQNGFIVYAFHGIARRVGVAQDKVRTEIQPDEPIFPSNWRLVHRKEPLAVAEGARESALRHDLTSILQRLIQHRLIDLILHLFLPA